MPFRRYGSFSGGIDLGDQKSTTLDRPLEPAPPLSCLLVPLACCRQAPATPLVRAGQRIAAGQKLAQSADPAGLDVFAPLSGTVESVAEIAQVATGEGFADTAAIKLVNLDAEALPTAQQAADWASAGPAELVERLQQGAITTFRLLVEPLAAWVRRARRKRCDVLIANAVEGQPYVTSEHRLLVEHGAEVVAGLTILGRAARAERLMLAVDGRWTDRYRNLAGAAGQHDITSIALPYKYPIGADNMLAKVLTRRACRPGQTAMDVGVAVTDASTCLAVFRWITCGLRPTGRAVTVAGERAGEGRNYWVPMGSLCRDLCTSPGPLIHGGPMVGLRCTERAVVGPATDAVLAIDESAMTPPTPCIRCGWCTDHCPARLNVAVLNDDFELSQTDHARRLGVAACVDCGVCTYVCPAHLPLTERVRRLKAAVRAAAVGLDGSAA